MWSQCGPGSTWSVPRAVHPPQGIGDRVAALPAAHVDPGERPAQPRQVAVRRGSHAVRRQRPSSLRVLIGAARQSLLRLAKYVARAVAKTSPLSTFTVSGLGTWTTGER